MRESVLGVHELPVVVGCGTDGASGDVSDQNGMRGKLQAALPWLYWAWYYAHRPELACKDAFSSHPFHDIDDMLLRLYYLYKQNHLGSAVNFQTLLMISRRWLNSLKDVIYLYELMEVAESCTSRKLCRELSIDTGLTLTTWRRY